MDVMKGKAGDTQPAGASGTSKARQGKLGVLSVPKVPQVVVTFAPGTPFQPSDSTPIFHVV